MSQLASGATTRSNSFEGISPTPSQENTSPKTDSQEIADQHVTTFGKVSARTGWSAVMKGELFGYGKTSSVTSKGLLDDIKEAYGEQVAQTVGRQMGLTKSDAKPLSSYRIAKAFAKAEELKFAKDIKMTIGGKEMSLDPNDPAYLIGKAKCELTALRKMISSASTPSSEINGSEAPGVEKPSLSPQEELKKLKGEIEGAKAQAKEKFGEKNFKAEYKEALNAVLREQEWPEITTIIQDETQEIKTTITPACQTGLLDCGSGVNGIPSSDTDSSHAIGLRINTCNGTSIVSSGLDVPLKKSKDPTAAKGAKPDYNEISIENRFKERLLINLQAHGKLPPITENPQAGDLGSEDDPITISMTDFGLLSAAGGKEAKAQTKQMEFLKKYDGTEKVLIQYRPPGYLKPVNILVKPKVTSFNFGAQWIDRSVVGRTYTRLCGLLGGSSNKIATKWAAQNKESLEAVIKEADDLNTVMQTTVFDSSEPSERIKTVFKNSTGLEYDEKTKSKLGMASMRFKQLIDAVRNARPELEKPAHFDYHQEALVVALASMTGNAPNIHCKSGKDRTSLLLSYSQWIITEVQTHGEIPMPGKVTPEQQRRLDKLLMGTGNGYWQFLNTLNVGNKQAAGAWFRASNFYRTVSNPSQLDMLGGNAAGSKA